MDADCFCRWYRVWQDVFSQRHFVAATGLSSYSHQNAHRLRWQVSHDTAMSQISDETQSLQAWGVGIMASGMAAPFALPAAYGAVTSATFVNAAANGAYWTSVLGYGIRSVSGQSYGMGDFAHDVGTGAISGGAAGYIGGLTGLTTVNRALLQIGADTAIGTTVDYALGGDFSGSLQMNLLTSVGGELAGVALGRVKGIRQTANLSEFEANKLRDATMQTLQTQTPFLQTYFWHDVNNGIDVMTLSTDFVNSLTKYGRRPTAITNLFSKDLNIALMIEIHGSTGAYFVRNAANGVSMEKVSPELLAEFVSGKINYENIKDKKNNIHSSMYRLNVLQD